MNTMKKPWHDLARLQRWMQSAITHPRGVQEGVASAEARQAIAVGAEEAESILTRSRALTALRRLAIYGSAYYARLLECLREEFPVLKHALGEDVFDAFAAGYLQQYPSRTYTLMELGANFPHFLEETRPQAEEGSSAEWADFLIDLATLELTFNEVFDGPGIEGEQLLDTDPLAAVPPEQMLESRLVPVSCLRLLRLRYPVHAYFNAVKKETDVAPPEPAETFLAVTRSGYVVQHHQLSRSAYGLLSALLAGEPIGRAIEQAVAVAGPDLERLESDLRTWFHDWAAEGFFLRIEVPACRLG